MTRLNLTGVLLLLALLLSACTSTPSRRPADDASLPGEAVPLLEPVHIPTRHAKHEPYTSVPPTSGPHVNQTVATGIYREEIPDEVQVHALEHGHIVVQYAPDTHPDQVALLERFAKGYPRDVVLAPYSKLERGIALTAWGRILRLEEPATNEMKRFVEALRGRYEHGWQE